MNLFQICVWIIIHLFHLTSIFHCKWLTSYSHKVENIMSLGVLITAGEFEKVLKKNKLRRGRIFGTRPRVNPCAQVSSIQNAEGIKTVKESFDNRTRKNAAAKVITTFLALIVTLNNVVFNCKYYF